MSEAKVLFEQEYDGESLVDMERDISEGMAEWDVPVDEYGFQTGTFKVTITWVED